ncbi:MAG: HNH endonuclease [Burkholderiales bacterium]|nr:HNH endonuclease [Burkholderiales bacterium]
MDEYKRNPNTNCIICSYPIYRRPIEIQKNSGRVFCSMNCYGLSNRKETPCVVCKKLILAGLNKKTCSRSCANIHRKGIQYKINSPNDKVKSQRALKIKLLKEKGKKCEKCNYDKYQILEVHHKNRNRKNNEIENLELICPNCHAEEHLLEKSWLTKKIENF